MNKAYQIRLNGRVTGVGFRYSTLEKVNSINGISGYVRNSKYGEVEVFIQGKEERLNKLIAWLNHGPALARVDKCQVNNAPLRPQLKEFNITS